MRMEDMNEIRIQRLGAEDRETARQLFVVMATVFDEGCETLGDSYLDRLLESKSFWAFAAFLGDELVGGVTAHTLPMTRSEAEEVFLFDIAVRNEHQRKGIGGQLVKALREAAAEEGIEVMFVPADNEDTHALDFYRALGGEPAAVTIFSFSGRPATRLN